MRSHTLALLVAAAVGATAAPLSAGAPVALHVGTEWRKMTREAAALKAVEAMGVKENFILAEVKDDGDAWGYDEKSAALVKAFPYGDGVAILIVVAGVDNAEAEGLRNRIREHVLNGPYDPKVPNRITGEEHRTGNGPAIHWDGEAFDPALTRLFPPAVTIALDRSRLQVQCTNPNLFFGANETTSVAAFCLPGQGDAKGYLGVVVASLDEKVAQRLPRAIKARILHILTSDE